MGVQPVTPASGLLVSLDEAKLACRMDATMGDTENEWLTRKIKSATSTIEEFIGRSVQEQTWLLALDAFSDEIELPRGPVHENPVVKYLDADGVEQTLDASAYTLDLVSDPQRIVRYSGVSWPPLADTVNAVRITFVAGFAAGPTLERVKDVCLDVVACWYDRRDKPEFPMWAKDRLRDLRRIVI